MADFGELCPLFNTGVLNEITFPAIDMGGITLSGNALYGSLFPSGPMMGYFTFGRTVVITGGFIKRDGLATQTVTVNLWLKHYASVSATGTVFGTATVPITVSIYDIHSYIPMTVSEKTFISTDILGLAPSLGALSGLGGPFHLVVRYKEK